MVSEGPTAALARPCPSLLPESVMIHTEGECSVPWVGFHFGNPKSRRNGRVNFIVGSQSQKGFRQKFYEKHVGFFQSRLLLASLDPNILPLTCSVSLLDILVISINILFYWLPLIIHTWSGPYQLLLWLSHFDCCL